MERLQTATPGQRVLWLMDNYRGGNGMMSVPLIYRLRGPLDVDALNGALSDLTDRHAALRTAFRRKDRRLIQDFRDVHHVELEFVDLTDSDSGSEHDAEVGLTVRELLRRDMDTSESVIRVFLIRTAEQEHLLVLDIHHLVTDAWSNMVISRDLTAFYNRRRGTEVSEPPEIVWQFSDYSRWQAEYLRGPEPERHQEHWREYLDGAQYPVTLPEPERDGRLRPLARNTWFTLEPDLLETVQAIARQERTTRFVVLLSLFFLALGEVTGQDDLTIGSIFANRGRREVQETVGYFANMVPIRACTGHGTDPRETVRSVRRAVLQALEHEALPYLTASGSHTSSTGGRLEDTVFHMLAVPPTATSPVPGFVGLRSEALHIPDGLGSRFDLELLIIPTADGVEGVFRYAGDRYPSEWIEDLAKRYEALARALVAA